MSALRDARARRAAAPAERNGRPPPSADASPGAGDGVRLTDVGNGRRFAAEHTADVRYCPAWGWQAWDGRRWARDETNRVQELAKQTVARMYAEAADEIRAVADGLRLGPEADRRDLECRRVRAQALLNWATKSEDARRVAATLAMARSDPALVVAADRFDRDPFALNVRNGTIDLRTGRLRPHDRADLITRLVPVAFDPRAAAPAWDRFLASMFGQEPGLAGWLQRLCGYFATGDVREQVVVILYGRGGNGKSTFTETLLDVLGDYGYKANAELLLASRSDRHETEKAALAGRRFVAACETGEGRRLNEPLVKETTGGDRITARFMKRDHFTFEPTFKLALSTNHRPEVRGTDLGIWRRVRLVPFERRFWKAGEPPGPPALRADPELRDKLRAELPGILAWIVRGAVEWHAEGLGTCPAVEAATGEYRQAEDKVAQFVDERCIRDPAAEVRASDLFAAYKVWAEARNEGAMTQTKFGTRLAEMFPKRSSNGVWYAEVRLRQTGE